MLCGDLNGKNVHSRGDICISTSGGDGIPVELFQVLKDDAGKVLHSICQQIWKTQPQDRKRSVFIPIPKKGNVKNVQITAQLHSSCMLATEKAMATHSSTLA